MSAGLSAAAIGGIAAGVGAIGGAVISANASNNAASEQEQAAQSANATQLQMYNQNNTNLQPFLNFGSSQIPNLVTDTSNFAGDIANYRALVAAGNPNTAGSVQAFENSPGYQFQLSQGEQSIQNSAAAKGGLLSGNTLQSLLTYGQGLAGTTYQNYLNDYNSFLNNNASVLNADQSLVNTAQGQVNTGLSAGGAIAGVSENTANNISSNTIGAANASAAGTVGSANAISSGLTGLGNSASTYGLLSQLTNQGTSSYGGAGGWTPSTGVSSGEAQALLN
jgi:hypothetical protein